MKQHILRSATMFTAGALMMALVAYAIPQNPAKGAVANGNDKFTMVTVQLSEAVPVEGVFVLNHLTGVLAGGALNEQDNRFDYKYLHNVAADFQTGATAEPKYAIVSAPCNLRRAGGLQVGYGVIYIGELSSGAVIAYTFPRPSNQNIGTTMPLVKLDYFKFAESVGQ